MGIHKCNQAEIVLLSQIYSMENRKDSSSHSQVETLRQRINVEIQARDVIPPVESTKHLRGAAQHQWFTQALADRQPQTKRQT